MGKGDSVSEEMSTEENDESQEERSSWWKLRFKPDLSTYMHMTVISLSIPFCVVCTGVSMLFEIEHRADMEKVPELRAQDRLFVVRYAMGFLIIAGVWLFAPFCIVSLMKDVEERDGFKAAVKMAHYMRNINWIFLTYTLYDMLFISQHYIIDSVIILWFLMILFVIYRFIQRYENPTFVFVRRDKNGVKKLAGAQQQEEAESFEMNEKV